MKLQVLFRTSFTAGFVFLALNSVAEARCTPAKPHNITFSSDGASDGSLTIRRTVGGVVEKELLDDTGYLSAQILASTLIQKDPEVKVLKSVERSETIQLLRLRLNKYKSVLTDYKPQVKQYPDIEKGIDKVLAEVKRIETILNRSSIVKENLRDAWLNMDKELEDAMLLVEVKSRDPGTSAWGKETALADFRMPILQRNFHGCAVDEVTDLQFGDAKQASIPKVAETVNTGVRQNSDDFFNATSGTNGRSGGFFENKAEKKAGATR